LDSSDGSGSHGAVTTAEQILDSGTQPEVLDVIEVPLEAAAPQQGQPENWDLAEGGWVLSDHLEDQAARVLLDRLVVDTPVFGTNERSIPAEDVQAGKVSSSLAVVRPEDLTWRKEVWPEGSKVRAIFRHAGAWHNLPVTDPSWLALFFGEAPGEYGERNDQDVYLVLSLGEPMNDEHWKLVAGVISIDR
jgi:hypothetical protein